MTRSRQLEAPEPTRIDELRLRMRVQIAGCPELGYGLVIGSHYPQTNLIGVSMDKPGHPVWRIRHLEPEELVIA